MKKNLLLLTTLALLNTTPIMANENIDDGVYVGNKIQRGVLFVLDISGSMSGSPLDSVKKTISSTLSNFTRNDYSGLISFSGCGTSKVTVETSLGANAHGKVIQKANALQADGLTDISNALLKAEKEVQRLGKTACTKVILLSDGADNCSNTNIGDISERIVSNYNKCNEIDTITIGVPDWESDVFKKIADKGKGQHVPKENSEDIKDAVEDSIRSFLGEENEISTWQGDYSGPEENDEEEDDKGKKKPKKKKKPQHIESRSEEEQEDNL